jgi:hypothetical protein
LARHSFVQESEQVPLPWSAQALEDETLMMEKWLAARGFPVRRCGGPIARKELPPEGTVVLLQLSSPLTEGEVDTLLAWVREGGRLLVDASAAPTNDQRGTKALLDRLGAVLEKSTKTGASQRTIQTDTFQNGEVPYRMRCSQQWRLRVDKGSWDYLLGNKNGEMLVVRQEGQGKILLTADCSFLYNTSFAELDHAAWLARVLSDVGVKPAKGVVVWSKILEMALFPWLWDRARVFLIACAVLLIAWLWAGMRRFGSVLPPSSTARRSLVEHLEASGRFLWHGGGRESLLTASRAAVLRLASRHHPAFPCLSEPERLALLSQRSDLPEEDIASALNDRPGVAPEEQALHLQILQTLRQRLTRIS